MSKPITPILMLSLLLAAPSALADVTPESIAKKVEAFYKDRGDVRATFVQKVKKPGRTRVLKKTGKVFFKRPGMMRWEYKKPEKVFYISDGTTLWSYQPEDALVTRLDVQSSELYHQSRYLFGQGDLAQDFKLGKGPESWEGTFALQLEPKRSSRDFKRLILFVDSQNGEIRRTELTDPYDNVSNIIFEKSQFKEVAKKFFSFSPPAGVTIKDLSKRSKPKPKTKPKK